MSNSRKRLLRTVVQHAEQKVGAKDDDDGSPPPPHAHALLASLMDQCVGASPKLSILHKVMLVE
jgi:hypothetical protein